jgi:hypothetical protein
MTKRIDRFAAVTATAAITQHPIGSTTLLQEELAALCIAYGDPVLVIAHSRRYCPARPADGAEFAKLCKQHCERFVCRVMGVATVASERRFSKFCDVSSCAFDGLDEYLAGISSLPDVCTRNQSDIEFPDAAPITVLSFKPEILNVTSVFADIPQSQHQVNSKGLLMAVLPHLYCVQGATLRPPAYDPASAVDVLIGRLVKPRSRTRGLVCSRLRMCAFPTNGLQ